MNNEIIEFLFDKGVDIVRFVDISGLPECQTQGFAGAVVFTKAFPKDFILAVREGELTGYEFADMEHETDAIADQLAEYLREKGFRAYSQSEESNEASGNYDEQTKTCTLPHKKIAGLAGIGYRGKNDLIISKEFGCAFSKCTVLTDAPVEGDNHGTIPSECGDCEICKEVCPGGAIIGNEWSESAGREGVVDVYKCNCALKCIVNCPKTLEDANDGL